MVLVVEDGDEWAADRGAPVQVFGQRIAYAGEGCGGRVAEEEGASRSEAGGGVVGGG